MMTVLNLEEGELNEGDLSGGMKGQTFIDILRPKEAELKQVSESMGISLTEIHEAIDPAERPRVADLGDYSLVVFRAPHKGKKIRTTPVAIFFNKHTHIILRHAELPTLQRFYKGEESRKMSVLGGGSGYLLFWILDNIMNTYFSYMDTLEEDINRIEMDIYQEPDEHLIRKIFDLKKVMIFFHKALTANREVLTAIEKEYLPHIPKEDIYRYRNTYNDVVQLLDIETTYRDILTSALDIYLTTQSNNLNIIMKKMTALGSFILIPTLITGIYGMNFDVMPETQWPYGYAFALGMMAFSVILLFIFFKKKRWL